MCPPLLLYSTNTYLKYRIQGQYRSEHYVWCSPAFSAEKLNKYAIGSGTPPSSDPATIYRDLLEAAVRRPDEHNAKILNQKNTLMALAVDWSEANHITKAQKEDIVASVEVAPLSSWRPLLFVIPFVVVEQRVEEVPRQRRASFEPEFIVRDLKPHEFGIVELAP
jgi:hypothetical protein